MTPLKITRLFLFLLFIGLQQLPAMGQKDAAIRIEWELITNFPPSGFKSEGVFKIHNKGEDLNQHNWALFFSMDPMVITPTDPKTGLEITHLNGDWFRISPKNGFSLQPGEDALFHYGGSEYVIKEGLGPKGFYMVFYDPLGKEQRISPVTDFAILPFTRKEQMLRGPEDGYAPYSPERIFSENEGLRNIGKEQLTPIVPTPYHYTKTKGALTLHKTLPLIFESKLGFEASYLQEKLASLRDISLYFAQKPAKYPSIFLKTDKNILKGHPESYQLNINQNGIVLTGTDAAGVFYGVQSLLSLVLAAPQKDGQVQLPCVQIEDQPRFGFRSLHLDVARNFQTKETVMKLLDVLAHYKLNHLLLYTSEDEGWRVEIPGLPELTEISSRRLHPSNGKETSGLFPAFGSGPYAGKENHGCGYYTREDFIEILKYADQRHIRVIPELNFPAHARAAIVAMENRYERLMQLGDTLGAGTYRLKDPSDTSKYLSAQFFKDNVVDISSESVYRFYEKIIDEFSKMYQEAGLVLRVVHVGGDEVATGAWSGSAKVARWAKERGVATDHLSLQAAFFRELMKILEKKGLEIHGWEEMAIQHTPDNSFIANPEFVGRNVVPYIWNNEFDYPDMGYRMANLGYDIVLCNVSNLYFDLAYDNNPREPGLIWGGFVDTKKAWAFAPYDFQNSTLINRFGKEAHLDTDPQFEKLKPAARPRIKGVQAQLWAETLKGPDMLEYYLLPKLIGFSETAWGKERAWEPISNRNDRLLLLNKDWNRFANQIAKYELPKLQQWNGGYHFRVPPVGVKNEKGWLKANTAFPGLTIRYAADGTEPVANSPKYEKALKYSSRIRFKAFVE